MVSNSHSSQGTSDCGAEREMLMAMSLGKGDLLKTSVGRYCCFQSAKPAAKGCLLKLHKISACA